MTTDPSLNYRESQTAFGGDISEFASFSAFDPKKLNRPFDRGADLDDLLKKTNDSVGSKTYDPNFDGIDPSGRNEFLDIPSFLYYPQDLGRNYRYRHFIVFNIYQGSSDAVRLGQRKIDQYFSAINASGQPFSGVGNQLEGDGNKVTIRSTLLQAGFSPQQIDEFVQAFAGSTAAQFVLNGITENARINITDQALSGWINNIFNSNINEDGAIVGAVGGVVDLGKEVISQIGDYFASFLGSETRNYLSGLSATNFDQVGISGRKVNRKKNEQSILLANRRFNFANVKSKDTICLHMPQKIMFNDQLVYSEEEMGNAKIALQTALMKRGAPSALLEKAGTSKISSLVDEATQAIGLGPVNIQAVRNATTRTVSNPRREALFKDVGIRSHSFTFEFAPRNSQEAETVLNIIRMLRYHAYPGLLGGGGHFYTFPAEFDMTFYTVAKAISASSADSFGAVTVNDNLPRMPRLALVSVSVDYSNAGDYKTFHDGKPAFIRLDLGFQEMEQLTNEHIIHGY